MLCLETRELLLILPSATAVTFVGFSWPARLYPSARECSKFNLCAARVSLSLVLNKCYIFTNLNRLLFCKFLPEYILLQSLLKETCIKGRKQSASIAVNLYVYVNKTRGKET